MAQRISIGIEASPPVAPACLRRELAGLQDALGGEGWHDDRGRGRHDEARPRPRHWLKVDKDEPRVGFGLGS